MKTYFPDDPVKQEMIEVLIKTYNHQIKCGRESIVVDEIKSIIERATGKKIEEVLG